MPARPQQYASREAIAHGHATGLDLALTRRLGNLATVHDGKAIPGAPVLVDRQMPAVRGHAEAWTTVGDLADGGAR